MGLLLIAVTLVKLVLAAFWGGTADIPQTLAQAQALLAGRDLLDPTSTGGNPSFFPIGHYAIAAGCLWLSQLTRMPFSFWIKTPAIFADLGVSWLLRSMPRGGNKAAFLYIVNPVTFLLSVYHGQLHTVAMAAALLAYWFADRGWSGRSGWMLGVAASVRQHFAVLLLPLIIRPRANRARLTLACIATALVINLPLFTSAHLIRILFPTWTYGSWGYAMLFQHSPQLLGLAGGHGPSILTTLNQALHTYGPLFYLLWAAGFVIWTIRSHSDDPWAAALLFLLGIYVISPGFGVQWLIWVVPFWLMVSYRQAAGYSLIAGVFLAGSYWQWSLNAKYGIDALTANLHQLSRSDLAGVVLVGVCGALTWLYAAQAAWRLARAPAAEPRRNRSPQLPLPQPAAEMFGEGG